MDGIFGKLKFLEDYDYYSGKEELKYLYLTENLPVKEQITLANYLVDELYKMYKEKSKCPSFHLYDNIPLICYMNPFLNKVNALVQDDIIDKTWIEELTEKLVFHSDNEIEVKIGLVLSKEYLKGHSLIEAVSTYSKSGEFIFYLMNSIMKLKGFNKYLLELSKRSKGTIKVFAITNIEYFNNNAIEYLVSEGYKDEAYEKILINYILTTVDLTSYIDDKIDSNKIDKLGYLISSYLRENDLGDIENVNKLLESYVKVALNIGDSLNVLNSLVLIREAISEEDNESLVNAEELEHSIDSKIDSKKWIDIFEDAVIEGKGISEDIIYLADIYNYKLELKDLKAYLEKNYMDFPVYFYVIEEGNKEEREKVINYFLSKIDINNFINNKVDISDEELKKSNIGDIIFSVIIKGARDIYPLGKDIAIKGINGNINKVRNESIRNLRSYKEKLTDEDMENIKTAKISEPNEKIKLNLEDLLFGNDGKTEYIDAEDIIVQEHVQDVYLLTTTVAGVNFRNRNISENELEKQDVLYLKHEENNYYDKNAIMVVSASGYVLGYIPKEENSVLCNLLVRGKYLYALVQEYDLDKSYIKINVYLSYKDVIESINNTLNMISSSKNGAYIN